MTYHYFRPHMGGLEEHIYQLSKHLVKSGNKVTIITSNIGRTRDDIRPSYENIDGIEVVRCKTKPWLFKCLKLVKFKKMLQKINPELFHAHHPIPGVSDTTIFYAEKHNYPSVLTYHADSQEDTTLNIIAAKAYYVLIARNMVKNADKIIVTTRSYAETSPVVGKFMNKTVVIPNGIDTKNFNPHIDGSRIRKKYKIQNKFVIFTLGRLVPYKGFPYLIQAMKYLNRRYILLLGGAGPLENKLKILVRKAGLHDRVIFVGLIPEKEKPEYYAACDLFVLPSISRGEAFGITLLEAMACGKPVLGSDIPGVREVALLGGMVIPPMRPAELAEGILTLSTKERNPIKLHALIRKKFSWEKIAKKVIRVYNSVLDEK